jgi:hypothetical protein
MVDRPRRRRILICIATILGLIYCGCDSRDQRRIEVQHNANDNRQDISDKPTTAEVVKVRVVPFTTAQGVRTQMVLVDWRNTGTTTIRAIDADIIVYDDRGNVLDSGAKDYTIYAVSDDSPGIVPGEIYTEPKGKGFTLMPGSTKARRAQVTITKVVESGAF